MRNLRAAAPAVLAAAGLAVRLGYAWLHPPELRGAQALHDRLAWNIAQGRGFSYDPGTPFFYPAPLYPALLGAFYRAAGHRPRASALAQAGLDALLPAIVYGAAQEAFGEGPALAATALAAFYPAFWTYAAALHIESLLTLSQAAFVLALLRALRLETDAAWAAAGLALSVATLVKSTTLPLPIVLGPLLALSGLKRPGRGWAILTLCAVLPLVPWCARNSLLLGRPAGLSLGAGAPLWHGSYEPWEGSDPVPGDDQSLIAEVAGKPYPYTAGDPEADRRIKEAAFAQIRAQPLRFVRLALRKPFYLWIGNRWFLFGPAGSFGASYAADLARRGPWVAAYSVLRRFVLLPCLLVLGAAGAWRERRTWRRWWPLALLPAYVTAIHMVFVVECGRYAVPLLPFVFILAGAAAAGHFPARPGRAA